MAKKAKNPKRGRQQSDQRAALFWLLGTLFLLATLLTVGGCTWVFLNPYVAWNPFPPPTLPPTVSLPPTATPLPYPTLPPTWTPTATKTPTVTPTLPPTATATATMPPTVTPTGLPTLATPVNTPGPTATRPLFVVQPGTPAYQSSRVFHPDANCQWLSVGGQVLEADGAPVATDPPLVVLVRGLLDGQPIDLLAPVGLAPIFGPAGYEAQLGTQPVASNEAVYVQLLDMQGHALSEPVFFPTYDDCERNVVIINFIRQP